LGAQPFASIDAAAHCRSAIADADGSSPGPGFINGLCGTQPVPHQEAAVARTLTAAAIGKIQSALQFVHLHFASTRTCLMRLMAFRHEHMDESIPDESS
jgi:hypothetical protein